MDKLLFEKETYKIIGCCMSVHKELGAGFLESIYHEALEKELKEHKIPFKSKEKLQVYCKNLPVLQAGMQIKK